MPIFEYECEQCGKRFEELVFGDDVPPCPACGTANTKKLLSCACFAMTGGAGGDKPSFSAAGSANKCSGCAGGNCSSCG